MRQPKAASTVTHLSGYQLMWMLVTFDLPVETKPQRAAASKFRMALLDMGFDMSQFSNYLRFCNGKEQFDAYTRRIESQLPSLGDVYIFQFTDRQYENIVRFSDQGRKKSQKTPPKWRFSDMAAHFNRTDTAGLSLNIKNIQQHRA